MSLSFVNSAIEKRSQNQPAKNYPARRSNRHTVKHSRARYSSPYVSPFLSSEVQLERDGMWPRNLSTSATAYSIELLALVLRRYSSSYKYIQLFE